MARSRVPFNVLFVLLIPASCTTIAPPRDLGRCCAPATQLPPATPPDQKTCIGKEWGVALPGKCRVVERKALCETGKSVVEVNEFTFQWDDATSKCKAVLDATKKQLITVDSCCFDRCKPGEGTVF